MSVSVRPPEGNAPSLGEDVAQRQEGSETDVSARPPEGNASSPGEDVARRQEDAPLSRTARWGAILLWLLGLVAVLVVVTQTRFTADLSAFLPRAPTETQRLLVDQLREGMVSRMLMLGVRGESAEARQAASRALAATLAGARDSRGGLLFSAVQNGEAARAEADQRYLFEQRYLLSPRVDAARFETAGLRAAVEDTLALLASPVGMLAAPLLPADPTGELAGMVGALAGRAQPARDGGVWVSGDGRRAMLLAVTAAPGTDTDTQAEALAAIARAFAPLAAAQPGLALDVSGPPRFAVDSRAHIEAEVSRLAGLGTGFIVLLLLLIYRSPRVLLLGLVPVATAALAGIAVVSLVFGTVHGLTLGFGTALIGEAVDYALYYFIQGRAGAATRRALWPTVRLGLLTSLCGFGVLLASGFPGLAQLGLYAMSGLVVAALVTRYVLPALLPVGFQPRSVDAVGRRVARAFAAAGRLRPVAWALLLGAGVALGVRLAGDTPLWHDELAALSPIPAEAQALDAELRAALTAPDARYLLLLPARSEDGVLAAAETAAPVLDQLVAQGLIGGYDSPATYLPSAATQAARRAALPPADELRTRLDSALAGLPVSPARLAPFVTAVAAAREAAPLTRASLAGTSMALAVEGMVIGHDGQWRGLLPLQPPCPAPPACAGIDGAAVGAALAARLPDARFVDLKHESDALYAGYKDELLRLSGLGVLAVVVLLGLTLRAPRRWLAVLLPLAAAVLCVLAGLALAGERLNLLHLVGLLLVVAVGSNYALFFNRPVAGEGAGPDAATLASLAFATATTVAGFGILGFSSVPVLSAIGRTVGPGAVLALLFAAVFAARRRC